MQNMLPAIFYNYNRWLIILIYLKCDFAFSILVTYVVKIQKFMQVICVFSVMYIFIFNPLFLLLLFL
jgi:hypothetical protein